MRADPGAVPQRDQQPRLDPGRRLQCWRLTREAARVNSSSNCYGYIYMIYEVVIF